MYISIPLGAIKRPDGIQFYLTIQISIPLGAIKSFPAWVTFQTLHKFQFLSVRLKGVLGFLQNEMNLLFQFLSVRLKVSQTCQKKAFVVLFQFLSVRLKGKILRTLLLNQLHFNSSRCD